MASVEFTIEANQAIGFETEDDVDYIERRALQMTTVANSNGLRRSQRCWDFPSWRLRRAAANKEEFDKEVAESADVNAKDFNRRTALHEAAKAGNLAVASYLLSRGARIGAQDDHGMTPLLEALRSNHGDLARILLAERRTREGAIISSRCYIGSPECKSSSPSIKFKNRSKMATDLKNDAVKWLVIIVNVGLVLCQAVASEEEDGRIGGKRHRDLMALAVCSCICLLIAVAEFVYEAKKNGAKWRKRRRRYCFYYPGIHTRVVGSFMLWFWLMISSTIQFCLNTAALVLESVVVKLAYLVLLLAVCLLWAAFYHRERGEKRKMAGTVKRVAHGECVGGPGSGWVFQFPHCHVDKLV